MSPKAQKITYYVSNISEIPGSDALAADDCVELWGVRADGTRTMLRSTNISHLRQLREANRVSAATSDVSVLCQGGAMDAILAAGYDHVELAIAKMAPKKAGARSVEFPASSLAQSGTTEASP